MNQHTLIKIIYSSHYLTEVVIGFNPDTYSVREPDGFVELFVAVLQGQLQRSVIVNVTLHDHTAVGKFVTSEYIDAPVQNVTFFIIARHTTLLCLCKVYYR